jgi:hypothetical protein
MTILQTFFVFCSTAPGQVLFDQAGLGRGKVGVTGDKKECRGSGARTRDLLRGSPRAVPPGHAGGYL